uniref:F-box domain-containing protein n=1 Tax=Leersia perrieri TaxID=77586 RepID=A0A0D9XZH3_9ORYZ
MDDYLPTDALVEILLRLPPFTRPRFRLVSRQWRDLIDDHTPDQTQTLSKPLVFLTRGHRTPDQPRSSAFVLDSDEPITNFTTTTSHRPIWTSRGNTSPVMIGSRNGILALLDETTGEITLTNPSTGETVSVPPPPPRCRSRRRGSMDVIINHAAIAFGFVPSTGRYKITHLHESDMAEVFECGGTARPPRGVTWRWAVVRAASTWTVAS